MAWRAWVITALFSTLAHAAGKPTVTVYTYDSFAGKESLGALMAERFEKRYGAKTKYVTFPSAGEAVNQLELEGKKTRADLLVGVDDGLLGRAKNTGLFAKGPDDLAAQLPDIFKYDSDDVFLAFDYGYLAFIYDRRKVKKLPDPLTLDSFSKSPLFAKSVVIPDPRTSSLGLAYLGWSHMTFTGKAWDVFLERMNKQIVTVAPGWSAAYALFLKGEAKVVLSYTTSVAYHRVKDNSDFYRAMVFKEGNGVQYEGAAVVSGSKNADLARKWLALLLSPEIQEKLPTLQWMYPVRSEVKLPESFLDLQRPSGIIVPGETYTSYRQAWTKKWAEKASLK